MDSVYSGLVIINENSEENKNVKIIRKSLRDRADILQLPDILFRKNFRVTKEIFSYLMSEVEEDLENKIRGYSVLPIIKLAACLRFLAEGCYQLSTGNDFELALAQSTFSKVFKQCLDLLERKLCSKWIKLQMNESEIQANKLAFYNHSQFPSVIGCVDGTHVRIIKPKEEAHLYYNRKGFFSLNVMLICDSKMEIRYVDSTHQGANHDSFVWNISEARRYFQQRCAQGEKNSWLLGDAGYPLEPWLITPFRSPDTNSRRARFNSIHGRARNIIERTIGVLKNRFRCLLDARQLHYSPKKASQIVNVACALHNICVRYNDVGEDLIEFNITEDADVNVEDLDNVHDNTEEVRNLIMNSIT